MAFSLAPALDRKEKVAALRELFHRVTAQPAHARISKARLEMKSIQIPLIEDLELVRDKTVIRGRMNIAVPLRNVGSGLAVVLPALITAGGQRIGAIEGTYVQSKLVPPGETTRVVCAPRLTQLEAASYPWIVILKVPYQDFTGGQPTIARIWLEQRYKETEWILHGIDQLIGDEAREQMEEARVRQMNPSTASPSSSA